MGIIDKLSSIAVTPITPRLALDCMLYSGSEADPLHARRKSIQQNDDSPSVSCLMVTHGDRWTLKYAYDCYMNQSYSKRELVIIAPTDRVEQVVGLISPNASDNVRVFGAGDELTLGDLRNMSVARAHGEILMQWDDDDLYDPLRISAAVSALAQLPAAAVLLSRLLIWWPDRNLAAISAKRLWEGSIAMWRQHTPVYPGLSRGEDTPAVQYLSDTHQLALMNSPLMYIYVVTGKNTYDTKHFKQLISQSECTFSGKEYHELIDLLSSRVPILSYLTEMHKN
jgi:glycosyltransferase involved in cell wall biosynthesis